MRLSRDEYFLRMAELVASRSTCLRRAVGCVLVNRRGHVLATGYNGVPAGRPHCNEGHPCPGASEPTGERTKACYAIHAEQNALLQCRDVHDIDTVYLTLSPCATCLKLFLNTSAWRVVAREEYHDEVPRLLWVGKAVRESPPVEPGHRVGRGPLHYIYQDTHRVWEVLRR